MQRARPKLLLALLCLAAQLLIAAAPIWHAGDHADDDSDQCAVCVAVFDSGTGTPPPQLTLVLAAHYVQDVTLVADEAGSVIPTKPLPARGPPAPAYV
jgi:hypothetical protein